MCTWSCFESNASESSGLRRSSSRAASKRVPWPSNLPHAASAPKGAVGHGSTCQPELSVPVPGIHHTSKNTGQQCQSLIPGARSVLASCVLLLASCVPLLVCCDSGDQRGSSYLELRFRGGRKWEELDHQSYG